MAISNNSTGLRPGVCTSTTRPTAPYEGQMIYETDTDLTYIWGGSAWQQVSGGTAVGNSGLVYVASSTVGTGVSSVTVSSAFSSTYDNYRIIYTGGTGSGTVSMTLGASITTYSNSLIYGNTYGTPTPAGIGASNGAAWTFVGYCDADLCHVGLDVFSPNLAKYTTFGNCSYSASTNAGNNSGIHATSTAYTSFTLIPAGTFTGGTVTVYGYRKA